MINQKKLGKGRKHGELICRDVLLLTCTRPSRLEEAMIGCRFPRETTRKRPVASHSHARTLRTLRMQRPVLPLTSPAHRTIDWIKERT